MAGMACKSVSNGMFSGTESSFRAPWSMGSVLLACLGSRSRSDFQTNAQSGSERSRRLRNLPEARKVSGE